MRGRIEARIPQRSRPGQTPAPAQRIAILAGTGIAVVRGDLPVKSTQGSKLRPAHMLLLFRLLAEAFGNPPEKREERRKNEPCKPQSADDRALEKRDRFAHRRVIGHHGNGKCDEAPIGQLEVHKLVWIELHEGIARGIGMHPQEVDLVVI